MKDVDQVSVGLRVNPFLWAGDKPAAHAWISVAPAESIWEAKVVAAARRRMVGVVSVGKFTAVVWFACLGIAALSGHVQATYEGDCGRGSTDTPNSRACDDLLVVDDIPYGVPWADAGLGWSSAFTGVITYTASVKTNMDGWSQTVQCEVEGGTLAAECALVAGDQRTAVFCAPAAGSPGVCPEMQLMINAAVTAKLVADPPTIVSGLFLTGGYRACATVTEGVVVKDVPGANAPADDPSIPCPGFAIVHMPPTIVPPQLGPVQVQGSGMIVTGTMTACGTTFPATAAVGLDDLSNYDIIAGDPTIAGFAGSTLSTPGGNPGAAGGLGTATVSCPGAVSTPLTPVYIDVTAYDCNAGILQAVATSIAPWGSTILQFASAGPPVLSSPC